MDKTLFLFKKAYSLIYPGDHKASVMVSGGRIERLLDERETLEFLGSDEVRGCGVIDYSNHYCYPGFFDSHVHLMQTGYNKLAVRLFECDSLASMKDAIEKGIASAFAGRSGILVAHGFDESRFAEKRFPDKKFLDGINAEIPIIASRVDHHSCAVNSAFIKKFRHFFASLGSGEVETGILRRDANYRIKTELIKSFGEKERLAAFGAAVREALAAGVTTLCALEGGNVSHAGDAIFVDKMTKSEKTPVNIVLFNQTTDVSSVLEMGLPRIGGCVMVDGSFGSMTAALGRPYRGTKNSGYLYFSREELSSFVNGAHGSGLQVACHAIGDRAISLFLDCLESVIRKSNSPVRNEFRHRIEHFELASVPDIRRAADLGIVLSMQPAFETAWGGPGAMYESRLGERRMMLTNRFRTISEAGAVIAGGSDSDVTPLAPLSGIAALLDLPNESERIGAYEAISVFTRNGAYANFLERSRGVLAPGRDADLTVLDCDITTSAPEKIRKASVTATIVGGRVRHGKIPVWVPSKGRASSAPRGA